MTISVLPSITVLRVLTYLTLTSVPQVKYVNYSVSYVKYRQMLEVQNKLVRCLDFVVTLEHRNYTDLCNLACERVY